NKPRHHEPAVKSHGGLLAGGVAGHLGPVREHFARPVAFDEREHCPHLIVRELAAKRRHVALIARWGIRRHQPILDDDEEHMVGVMPGVAAVVMRWRGPAAIGQAFLPVGLPFEVGAVAGGALLRVDRAAERHFRAVARLRAWIVAGARRFTARTERGHQRQPPHGHDCLMKPLISLGEANTMEARSPCMPAPTTTGLPGSGPSLLESVFRRRLNSQTLFFLPSAVSTV